jgi:hypothetical protein
LAQCPLLYRRHQPHHSHSSPTRPGDATPHPFRCRVDPGSLACGVVRETVRAAGKASSHSGDGPTRLRRGPDRRGRFLALLIWPPMALPMPTAVAIIAAGRVGSDSHGEANADSISSVGAGFERHHLLAPDAIRLAGNQQRHRCLQSAWRRKCRDAYILRHRCRRCSHRKRRREGSWCQLRPSRPRIAPASEAVLPT